MVNPVLKWVGGKGKLMGQILPYIPKRINNYTEPFLGGGSVLLTLLSKGMVGESSGESGAQESESQTINEVPVGWGKEAYIKSVNVTDVNGELINFWKVLKENPGGLREEIESYPRTEEFFLTVRNRDREGKLGDKIQRAARFLFINKMGFNGLWRENSLGFCNVPYGKRTSLGINWENLYEVSELLNRYGIQFHRERFDNPLRRAYSKGVVSNSQGISGDDFVYLDPPYDPVSKTSNFTGYSKGGFSWEDQERIKREMQNLAFVRVKVMLSNSDTPRIRELYNDPSFRVIEINAPRAINCKGDSRGKIKELLIMNYSPEEH